MHYTILDCYTDEPSGLGVPPYLGTYPRYVAGAVLKEGASFSYLTIDDLRYARFYHSKSHEPKRSEKTNIRIHSLTKNAGHVDKILAKTDVLVVIVGVQTPGKYLTAIPGTLAEVTPLIRDLPCTKVLTGPVAMGGTQLEGGRHAEKIAKDVFDEIDFNYKHTNEFLKADTFAAAGAALLEQLPYEVIAEIETMKGCIRSKGCDFCTEPLKNAFLSRDQKPIIEEMQALYDRGVRHFRLGKQTCFYTYKSYNPEEIHKLLKGIRDVLPKIKTLHIDNVNPTYVIGRYGRDITKSIVQYCTPGNIAAMGVESFDEVVVRKNNLNTTPELTYKAIQIINEYGARRGYNGLPHFLPGINLIFGLNGETKETHVKNYEWLKKILDDNLLLRRINIRQLAVFPETKIGQTVGNKFWKKNRKYYYSWRKKIREEIDMPMLRKMLPEGTIVRDVKTEMYDGNHTFGRQFGTYPLIVGLEGRLPLGKYIDVRVTKQLLRSITGEALTAQNQVRLRDEAVQAPGVEAV